MDRKHIAALSEKEQMRAWVENWKRIGPELERMKKVELRAMTEEEGTRRALLVMDSRIDDPERRRERRRSSGLVEQQRLFAKFAYPDR